MSPAENHHSLVGYTEEVTHNNTQQTAEEEKNTT